MRLPLAIPLDARNSDETIDARMGNMLVEQYEDKAYVVNRAGLRELLDQSGAAGGVIAFNGELICLFGTNALSVRIGEWDEITAPQLNAWRDVEFGNGTFVAVSASGTNRIITSSDLGLNWTLRSQPPGSGGWTGVAYGGGKFVAVSNNTPPGNIMYSTDDGATWQLSNDVVGEGANEFESIAYGGGRFVAVAESFNTYDIAYSANGIDFTGVTSGVSNPSWQGVAYGNGIFVAVGSNGNIAYSYDNGQSWTESAHGIPFSGLRTPTSVTFGDGQFVVVTSDENNDGTGSGFAARSKNGIEWEYVVVNGYWGDVVFNGNEFVATSNRSTSQTNNIMSSPNAIEWSYEAAPVYGMSIAYGQSVVVVTGNIGSSRIMRGNVLSESVGTVAAGTYDFAQTSN